MKVVWRNTELTVTYEKNKSEMEFPDRPRRLEKPAEPEILIPATTINAQQTGNTSGEPTA